MLKDEYTFPYIDAKITTFYFNLHHFVKEFAFYLYIMLNF